MNKTILVYFMAFNLLREGSTEEKLYSFSRNFATIILRAYKSVLMLLSP